MLTQSQAHSTDSLQQQVPSASLPGVFLFWSFIIALVIFSVKALHGPPPLPATAPAGQFSAERALVHVREIARVPHPLGSDANAVVRNYLFAQLSQLGTQPQIFSSIGVDPTARLIIAGKTNDIVARLPGTAHGLAIMLMAHYDSVYSARGAGDDASGIAAILETLRALRAGPPLDRDVIVLFTEGEEEGLLGAEGFAHSHPWAKDIGLIMNFDARGNRGPSMLFETSLNNRPLIEGVARSAPYPIGSSLFYEIYKMLPNDTDFSAFRPAKTPGLNFAFGEGLEAYHSRPDTPDNLSLASLQHHGSYGVALSRYFGQLDLATPRNSSGDDVFFDWFGSRLIVYSQSWVLPGEFLLTALLCVILVLALRRRQTSMSRYLLALPACLLVPALVTVAVTAAWWLLSTLLGDRRITGDSSANMFLLSGLMFLGALTGVLLIERLRRKIGIVAVWLAALSLWCVLSWVLTLILPSASYLLFWPLLLALMGNIAANIKSKPTSEWIRNVPAIAAAILLFAPGIYLGYIYLTLQLVSVAVFAAILGLFLLLSLPAIEPSANRFRLWSSGALALATIVCVIFGIALPGYSAERPRPDSIFYSLNADDHTAAWITYDQKADAWTQQFLGANAKEPHPVQKYVAGFPRPLISASAPALPLAPPVLENVKDKKEGDVHKLKLRIRSQRGANALYLRFAEDVHPISAKVAGRDVPVHQRGRFGLTLHAMGDEGVELELAVTAPSRLSLWVMDRTYGLPANTKPRPAEFMESDGSDVTYVCRKYEF